MNNEEIDIIFKNKYDKDIKLIKIIEDIKNSKSKYSTFGGDTNTCSIEIPEYLKHNRI